MSATIEIVEQEVVYQVFEAVDGYGVLPVGCAVSLELLDSWDDGIFATQAAWRRFVFGNFADGCEKGAHWLEGECKASTIKKYCYRLAQYKNLFVIDIGGGRYVKADPANLDFKFTFDANYYYRHSDFCGAVEIMVTATLKS